MPPEITETRSLLGMMSGAFQSPPLIFPIIDLSDPFALRASREKRSTVSYYIQDNFLAYCPVFYLWDIRAFIRTFLYRSFANPQGDSESFSDQPTIHFSEMNVIYRTFNPANLH